MDLATSNVKTTCLASLFLFAAAATFYEDLMIYMIVSFLLSALNMIYGFPTKVCMVYMLFSIKMSCLTFI